jgi:hypothetical protein
MTMPRRLHPNGRPKFQLTFYALNKRGEVGAASIYPDTFAASDSRGVGPRDTAFLYDRPL